MPREHDRTAIVLEIILEFSAGAVRVSDLSHGGCFVDSIASVQAGETVKFRLKLADEQWEAMSGTVAYILPGFGFGLHFEDVSEEQKIRIAEIIVASGGTV